MALQGDEQDQDVDVLTPTYGRPVCLDLCQRWVAHQSHRCRHIISHGPDVFANLRECLDRSTASFIMIFEDDDWYPSHWVESCVQEMRAGFKYVGQSVARLYHVPSRGWDEHATSTAGFQSTAFHADLKPLLYRVCEARQFNSRGPELERPFATLAGVPRLVVGAHVVSMKGMPGTRGYSKKHDAGWFRKSDPDGSVLRSWLGGDADIYLNLRC